MRYLIARLKMCNHTDLAGGIVRPAAPLRASAELPGPSRSRRHTVIARPQRDQAGPLRFRDPGDIGDIHAGVGAGRAQYLQTAAGLYIPEPDHAIPAATRQD